LRKAIAAWYNRPVSKVDYQIIKYRHRAGWTHRDLLRLAHVRPASPEHSALFRWIINHEGKTQQTEVHALFEELTGTRYTINDLVELLIAKLQLAKRLEHKPKYVQQAATKLLKDVNRAVNFGHLTYSGTDQVIIVKDKANCIYCKNPKSQLIQAVNDLEETNSVNDIAFIVSKFKLPREAVESKNTELLNERKIWEALLPDMPMTALIRNLGQMSAKEFLVKNSPESKYVIEQLREDKIKAARIHPISLLSAYKVYEQSHGMRGKLIWTADADIVEALEEGFYKAFQNVEPTGRNRLLALDISGSMYGSMVAGIPGLDAGTTAAAIALVTINVEPHVTLKAFAHELIDLELSKKEKIHRVVAKMQNIPMGGTDCALPILWALKNHSQQDSFETFTDSETWSGRTHPHQALKQYRAAYNPQAKFVVVGMCSNEFTIADPNDAGSLDIVGCDPNTPRVIADFVKGESWLN
jgi:60 kDa SS-A/Ro ribonucleoprotein